MQPKKPGQKQSQDTRTHDGRINVKIRTDPKDKNRQTDNKSVKNRLKHNNMIN